MSVPDASTLPLKVTINKQKSKVLLAEANSDVVDVLLSFLTLPLGNIVRILEKHYAIDEVPLVGSLTTLYRGLSNLDTSHFCVAGAKQMLLNPTSSFQKEYWRLKLDITEPRKIYYCQDSKCPNSQAINVSLYSDIANCVCGKPLNRQELVEEHADLEVGVFMIKSSSYIICDDLRAAAVDSGFLQTLNYLGITDGAEMSILSIDNIDDIMDLLKFSLISTTPLTDLVMKKTQKSSITATKPEPEDVLHDFQTHLSRINSRKMSLKILLQKSSSKFLLAVASDEFVEFLFSLLAIPLGGVEYLLGGNTCLKNIDNLYTSVRDVFDNKCFTTPDMKQRLLNPKLPHGYIYKNQFLPLREESSPPLFIKGVPMVFKSSKIRHGGFMKGQTMFSVSDDLTVTPFSITSSISIPNDLGIALSDVTEKDFQIGLEEALSILKTSLSSTTVFTDALINPMLNKPPKQPKIEPCSLFINLVGLLVSSFVMSLFIGSFWGGINH